MGGGQNTPATSTPDAHNNRYQQSVFKSVESSDSGSSLSDSNTTGIQSGRLMADGAGYYLPEDAEMKDGWVSGGNSELMEGDGDLFSQYEFEFTPGNVKTVGVKDEWVELENATASDVAASQLAASQQSLGGIIDSDGMLREKGARQLQEAPLLDKFGRTADAYDADAMKSLGAKIRGLRNEHGTVDFTDSEITEKFTTGEKEILANWEITGSHSFGSDVVTENSEFMGTAVVSQTDTTAMETALQEQGEVLVKTHNNSSVDDITTLLKQKAGSGELSVDVDVGAISEKLHAQQKSSHVVAVTANDSLSPSEQVESFDPSREGKTKFKKSHNSIGDGSNLSPTEMQAVAESVVETGVSPKEFKAQLSETLGYKHAETNDYADSITMPSENTAVLVENSTDSGVEFEVSYTQDGRIHERKLGSGDNPDPLPYRMDDVQFVYAETTTTENGKTVISNVQTGTVNEFEFDEDDVTRGAKFEPDGSTVQVIGEEDIISNLSDVQQAAQSRADSGTGLSAPDDVNTPPDASTVPTVSEIRQGINDALFDNESESTVFVTGRESADGKTQKQTGDDGEELVKSAIYSDYDPREVEAGNSETNKFLDVSNAAVEVKTYKKKSVESKKVGLGSRDPWSEDIADDSFSSEPTEWAEDNCTPKTTRYVVLKYSDEPIDPNSISVVDAKEIVNSQPTVDNESFFKNGTESAERIQNGESTMEKELTSEIKQNLHRIEGAVITNGEHISSHEDIDLNVKKKGTISPKTPEK